MHSTIVAVFYCLLAFFSNCSGQDGFGFANLNRETTITRALQVTDLFNDLRNIGIASSARLALYPQFRFIGTSENLSSVKLIFGTSDLTFGVQDCIEEDLTVGAWRFTERLTNQFDSDKLTGYTRVSNFQLQPCYDENIAGIVCCTFSIPDEVQKGDILGILHGESSTLLHEGRAAPQLQVLHGEEQDRHFVLSTVLQQQGFPLMSFKPSIVSGLLSYNRLTNLLSRFQPITFFRPGRVRFNCSGEIEAFYLAGIPRGDEGQTFTFMQWRSGDSTQRSLTIVDEAVFTVRSLSDIVTTEIPNLYKILTPPSRFVLEVGDTISIAFSNLNPGSLFELQSINAESPSVLRNAMIPGSELSVSNFPLLSLQVSGDECGGNILYDLDVLANRALQLQDIDYPPFSLQEQDESSNLMGYIYFFPNITFTENGSIFLWRFGARITNDPSVRAIREYPRLQVWRLSGDGGYGLVSSSDSSQEPSLEPGALNTYRYDVNLTYEAGDILAIYQPVASRSSYLMAFVNSTNYTKPNVALEVELAAVKQPILHRLANFTFIEEEASRVLVEPVMSILSTSMPNDTVVTATFPTLPPDPTPTAGTTQTEVVTSNPITSPDVTSTELDAVNTVIVEQDALIPTVIGTVVGGAILITLLVIAILLLAIFLSQRRYRIAKQELANEGNPAHQGSINCIIDGSTHAHHCFEDSNEYNNVYASVTGLYYETPVPSMARGVAGSTSKPVSTTPAFTSCTQAAIPIRTSFAPLSLPTTGMASVASSCRSSGDGVQFAHSQGITSRNNAPPQVQAYEVPMQSIDTKDSGGPKDQSNQQASSQNRGYDWHPDYDDPTTEKLGKNLNSIANIYYSLHETQLSSENYDTGTNFFEESEHYWAPASDTSSLYQQMATKRYREIPRNQIQETDYLGAGQFGTVYKGVWKGSSSVKTAEVAVKILNKDAEERDMLRFLQEGAINGQFHHPNVVKLLGMVTIGKPVMIVLEYLSNGDLSHFLRKNRAKLQGTSSLPKQLLGFCQHIAAGMDYLSSKGFVHRDLAARNVLLTENQICKITDFGLSRDLEEENYYISHGGLIPVKWTAPEALSYRKYSTASDVWSFGVVMYEIWSLGRKPFADYENIQVVKLVRAGHRMKAPADCPREIYKMMMICWHPEASSRPQFSDLLRQLCILESELQICTKRKNCSETEEDVYPDLEKFYDET